MTLTLVELLLVVWGALVSLGTPIAVVYARRSAQAAGKLVNVEPSASQLQALETVVKSAVACVDERVHKYVKGLVNDAPTTSTEKHALAIQTARELAPDHLKAFSNESIGIVVDAAVHDRRVSLPLESRSIPPLSSFPPRAMEPLPSYDPLPSAPELSTKTSPERPGAKR